jgi:hypothetical protein
MEDKKVQKINRTLQGVNAGVREMVQRFDDYLKSQSFATLDTAIAGGGVDNAPTSQITTISCSALKGEIPKDSYFIISYPDGTHPKSILNKKSDLAAGATSIVIHDGSGTDDQTIYADFPYPVGSLLSAVQYAGNDTQFAAGNTTEIQYNTSGQLSADSNFTYNDGTDTLSATNIVGDLTGDVTGNADTATTAVNVTNAKGDDTAVQFNDGGALAGSYLLTFDVGTATLATINTTATNITGALTGTSSLSNGVTAYNLAISDNSSKVANTKFVHDAIADEDYGVTKIIAGTNVTISPVGGTGDVTINSTGGGGGTPAGLDTQVQFNDGGSDFGASANLTYTTGNQTLHSTTFSGTYVTASDFITAGSYFRGSNIGTISDNAIYLTPFDFQTNSDVAAKPYTMIAGATAKSWSSYDYLLAGFVVPVGYVATHIEVKSTSTLGTTRTYSITQFDWDTATYAPHGNYDVNTNEEITNNVGVVTPLVGTAGRYWSVAYNPQYASDQLLGAKITLAEE